MIRADVGLQDRVSVAEWDAVISRMVPPPRLHRHRYFGVLAPNSPLRSAVTPHRACPRGPPRWEATDAEPDPAADPLLQPAPVFEFDQRIAW